MLRARTLIVSCVVALVSAALVSRCSRAAPDAPRSLSAEHGLPSIAPELTPDAAVLAVTRRSADPPAGDDVHGRGEPTAPNGAEKAAVAPRTEPWLEGRVRYADDQSPAPDLEFVLQQGEAAAIAQTDAEGRFRVALDLGAAVQLELVLVGPTGAERHTLDRATTDDDGQFQLGAAPAERIVVSASLGLFGDEYESRELDAPFGARDLVFRRTRTVPFETVAFEVVDASTGSLVRDVLVLTDRALAHGDYSFHSAEEGRARPRFSLHADTTCLLEAPGYRRRAVLADLESPTR